MKLNCYSYRLPFSKPLQTSTQTYQHRKGLILSYHKEDQQPLYGEVAPLAGFSNESFESAQTALTNYRETLTQILAEPDTISGLQNLYQDADLPPSTQFGLDTLGYQIEARNNKQSLLNYLFDDASPIVAVNALISLQEMDVLNIVADKIDSGFKTIKCKVGLHFEKEFEQLRKIRNEYPNLSIRVDANQAWDIDEAIHNLKQLQQLNVEYCEEPLKVVTPENFEKLTQHISLPIALDESTTQHSFWPDLLPFTSYLVMKPMVIGSFHKNFETKRLANTHNNKVVVTSSLESGVGRYFTAFMAAGLGSPNHAHGLSTGSLFDRDIFPEKDVITDGFLDLSSRSLPSINFDQQHLFTKIF